LTTAELRQCKYKLFTNKIEAAQGCDIITADTWVSMGEDKSKAKMFLDGDFMVDEKVMQNANKGAIFLHCLPAYRGYEVASEVIDNPSYSKVVFQEAGNRLHAQKAILMYCFDLI
jgi:ornithine carbamoyltransferase